MTCYGGERAFPTKKSYSAAYVFMASGPCPASTKPVSTSFQIHFAIFLVMCKRRCHTLLLGPFADVALQKVRDRADNFEVQQ